jgi:hypothetical protein
MPIKGTVGTDHFPRNKFSLEVVGIPVSLTILSVGELETELETATLSDRRMVSGGNTKALETDVVTPAHHSQEQFAWEKWFTDSQLDTALDYKKPATLSLVSSSGLVVKSWILTGVFPTKRKMSDLDMENEGEDTRITWTLSIDEMTPAAA